MIRPLEDPSQLRLCPACRVERVFRFLESAGPRWDLMQCDGCTGLLAVKNPRSKLACLWYWVSWPWRDRVPVPEDDQLW